jgi:hypothetical protein
MTMMRIITLIMSIMILVMSSPGDAVC